MSANRDWQQHMEKETLKRIAEMEATDYVFPPAFSSLDWALAILTILISGYLLIAGAAM